jgi:glycosyltransferase involved in cell wall biosynthesis
MARWLVNFVSNLPKNLRSGGFSAMNAAAFAALSRAYPVHYAGPINPGVIAWQKALSKFSRLAGAQGDFFFFSTRRLEAVAREVSNRCRTEARLDFFHGFTPWILTKPRRPYVAWGDCTFFDYMNIYHSREQFRKEDINRIQRAEAEWLANARRVILTSDWAAERAVSHYALDASRVSSVGIFGEIEIPDQDIYAGGREFAFVSTNFEAKGGRVVLSAFREVRKRHPDISLTLVGDQPGDAIAEPGVNFAGFLRKEVPKEHKHLQQILGRARALVYPTQSDISPLLIIEAGYCGCPVISSRKFAISELVDDGISGLLLNDSSQPEVLANAMAWMLQHENEYRRMRQAAWSKSRCQHSKESFEKRLISRVQEVLPAD